MSSAYLKSCENFRITKNLQIFLGYQIRSKYLKTIYLDERKMSRQIALVTKIFESRMTRIGISGNLVPIDTWEQWFASRCQKEILIEMSTTYLPERNCGYRFIPVKRKILY